MKIVGIDKETPQQWSIAAVPMLLADTPGKGLQRLNWGEGATFGRKEYFAHDLTAGEPFTFQRIEPFELDTDNKVVHLFSSDAIRRLEASEYALPYNFMDAITSEEIVLRNGVIFQESFTYRLGVLDRNDYSFKHPTNYSPFRYLRKA